MRHFTLRIIAVIIALLVTVPAAFASGPGEGGRRVRLDNEPAGPYLIRAMTSPTPPTIENFNVEVKVNHAQSGEEVLDAQVLILAVPVEHEAVSLQEIATHEFAPLPTEYAAHLAIPEPGLWFIRIQVESNLGFGEATFYQQVSNPPALGTWISIGAPVGGLALLAVVFFWLQRNSPKRNQKSA